MGGESGVGEESGVGGENGVLYYLPYSCMHIVYKQYEVILTLV